MKTEVILVDEQDNKIGVAEKLHAHQKGLLHRAFSIFVFNDKGELLMQRRAKEKYHSGGLWTNTCCSHPAPNEKTMDAAHRRLQEEMGFDCPLTEVGALTYRTEFENGLTEHEYDYLYLGTCNEDPILNPEEADGFKWANPEWILLNMKEQPNRYTYWFKLALPEILKKR